MLLFAVFLILLAAWMFWGWLVGESRDIRWMRNWCAGVFVVLAILICLGSGALLANRQAEERHRASVQRVIHLLHARMNEGRIDDVKDALRHLAEVPAEWSTHSPDILTRLAEVTAALEKTARTRVAEKPTRSSANSVH